MLNHTDTDPLDQLSRFAIRPFRSTRDSVEAILLLISNQLGLRTSLLTHRMPNNELHVLYAHNAPEGCTISPGIVLPFQDTF